VHEQSRRRLFDLYDHHTGEIVVRRDQPKTSVIDPLGVDVLPAVAYGIVVRASPRRRQAMLAFAAGKRVTLTVDYDAARNRCGLPPPLLELEEVDLRNHALRAAALAPLLRDARRFPRLRRVLVARNPAAEELAVFIQKGKLAPREIAMLDVLA
jgi:hypothetical protein